MKFHKVFNDKTEEGRKRWDDLKSRVVEHNIRIMAKYYTQVSLKRMSELLDLKETETEEFLSKMVVDKAVEAKVDRLDIEGMAEVKKIRYDEFKKASNQIGDLMQECKDLFR